MAEPIDNSAARQEALAAMGRALAGGRLDPAEVREAKPWLDRVDAEDVVVAVDSLVAGGMDLESMKGAVSRLLNLVSAPLKARTFEPGDPFFSSLVAENRRVLALLDSCRAPLARLNAAPTGGPGSVSALAVLSAAVLALRAVEIHFVKKETVFFPWFEARHPRYRCLKLMWSIHGDVRATLGSLPGLLAAGDNVHDLNAAFGRLFFDLHALVFREERILFPVAAALLGEEEKAALFREAASFGYCLLDGDAIAALESAAARDVLAGSLPARPGPCPSGGAEDSLRLDSGSLSPALLDLVLKSLPLDLTFVDAEDRVRYFSNGKGRIFPRSRAIIGRDVRNCHPAESVDRVLAVIDSLRLGHKEREDFWLQAGGRFILVSYIALRGPGGEYLGTLESSQDLTGARALQGEKRLASPGPA